MKTSIKSFLVLYYLINVLILYPFLLLANIYIKDHDVLLGFCFGSLVFLNSILFLFLSFILNTLKDLLIEFKKSLDPNKNNPF